jgi:GAF domain-containing protein
VVPLHADGRVCAVLDIDSTEIGTFDDTDRRYLEQVAAIIAAAIEWKATKG